MKRHGNLYEKICDINNMYLADEIACKGKSKQLGVINHIKNRDMNLLALQNSLLDKTFRTSKYQVFKVYEPKEREVYRLPYFPDRIAHHAIMNILEPIFVSTFPKEDMAVLEPLGFKILAYEVTDYKFHKANNHWLINQESSVLIKQSSMLRRA